MLKITKYKKAIMIEALMRTLLMIAGVLITLSVGATVYKTLIPQSDEVQLKKLATALNSIVEGEVRPFLIGMGEKNGLFGFSKDSKEFICVNCYSSKGGSSYTKKPTNPECSTTACVCLCDQISLISNGKESRDYYGKMYEMTCKETKCLSVYSNIKNELSPYITPVTIGLNTEFVTEYPSANSNWENGFFYTSSENFREGVKKDKMVENTGNYELSLQANKHNGELTVAVCPITEGMQRNCASWSKT